MADPAKIAFFQTYQKEVAELIRRENARRELRKIAKLSEDEIDCAMGDISAQAQGLDPSDIRRVIRKYRFVETEAPQQPHDEVAPTVATAPAARSARTTPAVPAHGVVAGTPYTFHIVCCANGFVLQLIQPDQSQSSYVFTTPTELLKICESTVFVQLDERQQHDAQRARVRNDDAEHVIAHGQLQRKLEAQTQRTALLPDKPKTSKRNKARLVATVTPKAAL